MAAVLVDFGMSETEVLFGGSTNDIQNVCWKIPAVYTHCIYTYIYIHVLHTVYI